MIVQMIASALAPHELLSSLNGLIWYQNV